MPKKMDWNNEKELRYVLTHEYIHIYRFDTVTKLLVTAALCIHWFNPMICSFLSYKPNNSFRWHTGLF